MKKFYLFILFILVSFTLVSCKNVVDSKKGFTIRPLYTYVDAADLPDGIYPSEFMKQSIIKEGEDMYLKIYVFSKDIYDAVEVKKLKAGDSIERYGEDEKIENIIWDDKKSDFCINFPSFDEAPETYSPMESGGTYVMRGPDDHASYTNRGQGKYKVNKNCKLIDASEDWIGGNGVKTIEYSDIENYILSAEYEFYNYLNTTIRIENKEIVEINRKYIP